jgi:hypothetical protein
MTCDVVRGRLAFAAIVLLAPTVVAAKLTPAQKCVARKLAAAGRATAAKAGCGRPAVRNGPTVDPLCVARAELRLLKAFQRAERNVGCETTGSIETVGAAVDACVAGLQSSVLPPTTTTTPTIVTTTFAPTTTSFPPDPSFRGRIALEELSVDGYGQGLELDVRFVHAPDEPTPVWEEMPGSDEGCKVWSLSPAQATDVGLNEGGLQISGGTPHIPSCGFSVDEGYVCASSTGTGGILSMGPAPGTAVFTYVADLFSSAQLGNYLLIAGAAQSANNGAFPIIAVGSPYTLTIAAPTVVAETLPASATWATRAAAGIVPGVADPGFLLDDDTITVRLSAGTATIFGSFERSIDAGDDVTLDTPSTATLTSLPLSGVSFSVGCSGPSGHCGAANYTALVIRTTDASLVGVAPTAMPAPVSKSVVIRCASATGTTRTVPADAASFLTSSGASRVEARYARTNRVTGGPPYAPYAIEVGHAVAAYTTPPP